MIIRHDLPNQHFTKIDRYVVSNMKLSDGAVRLYAFLCGVRNGANITDAYLMKCLDVSQKSLYRRKAELRDAGLVLMDQLGKKVYVCYIGHSRLTAEQVKQRWELEDGNDGINS